MFRGRTVPGRAVCNCKEFADIPTRAEVAAVRPEPAAVDVDLHEPGDQLRGHARWHEVDGY